MKRTKPIARLILHSSERMPEIADGTVALTVTSPPYWNAIDYETHASDNTGAKWYRERQEGGAYEDWLGLMGTVFGEVYRVTGPGRFCAIVIGTLLHDGRHYPCPHDLTQVMRGLGWQFADEIIWAKCTAGVKRAGSVIAKRLPGYFYPNIMTEHILIFRKPGEPIYRGRSLNEKASSVVEVDKVFVCDTANNIWHIAPVPPLLHGHPCPFPEDLAHRLITLYSYVGDTVLDPFNGVGTTTKIAKILKRNYRGYEIHKKYFEIALKRLNQPSQVRTEQLVPVFTKVRLGTPLEYKYKKGRRDQVRVSQPTPSGATPSLFPLQTYRASKRARPGR